MTFHPLWLAAWFIVMLLFLAGAFPSPGMTAVAGGGRYGPALRFDPPPVDVNNEALPVEQPEDVQETPPAPSSAREIAGQEGSANVVVLPAPEPLTGGTAATSVQGSSPENPAAPPSGVRKSIRLFGTVEFRAPLKDIPKWERVLRLEQKRPTFGVEAQSRMSPAVAARWASLREKIKDLPLMEKAKAVNNFFNQWPYKSDIMLWGVTDYWETPAEFLGKSGDCEDYAISKYYALRSLDVPAKQLRIVALRDTIRNLGHAVLAVYIDGNAYILDNLSNMVLVHTRLTHYAPQFSVNEEFRWAHIKPLNAPKK